MARKIKARKIGELEFKPHTFPTEPVTFIFDVWLEEDGSYAVLSKTHPVSANMNIPNRIYSLGEMFGIMNIFKNGKIISNTLPPKIMERAKRELILLKLE